MMDFLEILKVDYENIDIFKVWTEFVLWRSNAEVFLISATAFLISALIVWYVMKRRKLTLMQQKKIFNSEMHSDLEMRGLRFRKRDKMLFYGRRMLRKVKTVSGQVYGGQGRKRRAVVRFAKKFLHLRRENIPHEMKTVEPPPEYLQEAKDGENRVPPDALYMLQSIRIFGHFEKPVFLKLCKNTEILNLEPGDCLFKITDADDSVYIVQSGQINVFISNADGSTLSLKTVRKGESVTSLLSFIDVLSGNPSYYKTVTAKAMEKSQVIRLPMMAFQEVFDENSDMMIRVIQVIMVRLQRVLFTALRSYLGLTSELMQNHMRTKKCVGNPNIHQNAQQGQQGLNLNSPSRRSQNDTNNYEVPDMLADCYDSHHQWSPLANNNPPFPTASGGNTSQNTHVGNLSTRRYSITPAEQHINAGSIDQKLMRASAVGSFLKELGLPEEDRQFIDKFVEVYEVEAEDVLIREGNREDACVWFVMTGSLSVYQQSVEVSQDQSKQPYDVFVHQVHPGEIVGGLAVLTAEASAYTIIAKQHSRLAVIPREGVYELMRERPKIIVHLGNGVVRRLSPLVRQCDYALDWIFLESGRAVYRQDETSDSTYIVLSGRMRSVITHCNGKKEIVGEFGKGDLVGIVEMITQTTRTTTVMAVRDSELAKLPEGLFNAIKLRYPIVVSKLISLLSHRILGTMESHSKSGGAPLEANPVTHKYSTVALVPVNEDVPLTTFTYELYHSLCAIGPTLRLTSESVCQTLGQNIFEPANEYRLTSWLAQQEDQNIITLYQCDDFLSPWTLRCLRQSDVVLIVGLGEHLPTVGQFEREIDRMAVRTQKELVLLYNETFTNRPENTLQWLNARPWVTKHHHIKCVRRVFSRKSQFRINDLYSRVLMSQPNMHSDFSRLARWLTGNSIGVVLGGGGARGAAHIGMLKATQEAGIPIDMVGGVSIGALMGALWCAERDITTVTHKAREWSKLMTKWYLQLFDLTYPITSMFSGREFNKTIRNTLGESNIEDLWIPYFTLTTDITASCRRIHTNGSLWRYVRSSMSLSGYMPPLCDPKDGHLLLDGGYVNNLPGHLWRYVRASMSIAGILPPFCDYKDGHLLLDGCYTNNVPADVMRNLGAAHIIAIDVGSQDDTDLTNYGDDLSGWWLLYKKYNPFTSPVKVPDLPDIQSRLAYVSCVRQLEEVKNSDYCEYIRPPIDKYKTLAFGSFDEIRDVGYVFGKNHFELMSKAGRLDRFNQWFNKTPAKKSHNFTLNEYTFIDLAQIVCKVPQTHLEPNSQHYLFSEDEDMDGYISEPSIYRMTPSLKMKRSGTSLSLSENEMDSDVEVDLHLPIKQRAKHLLTPNSISPSRHHSNYPHRNQSKSPKNKCVQVEMSKDDGPNIDEIDTTPKQVTYRHAAQQISRETETTPTNTRSTNGIEKDEIQSEVMDQIITLGGEAPLESNQVEENNLETELEKELVGELVRELVDENSLNDSYAEENEATVEDLKDTSGKTA